MENVVDFADFVPIITTAFAGLGAAFLAVATVALGYAGIKWGFPQVVAFFKKLAR